MLIDSEKPLKTDESLPGMGLGPSDLLDMYYTMLLPSYGRRQWE